MPVVIPVIRRLRDLSEWEIVSTPAASTTKARLQFGSDLTGGHASGTWIGGKLTGNARIFDFHDGSGNRAFAVDSNGYFQVGGTIPSAVELGYLRRNSASQTSSVLLDNQTDFTSADTPVRWQVRAVLSAATKLGYFGLDRYFRSAGMLLISTDAVDGIGFSPNNNHLRARLTGGGDFYIAGGFGCGNSVVASALGSVSRVAAIYDASGSLLGYVPVYASYS